MLCDHTAIANKMAANKAFLHDKGECARVHELLKVGAQGYAVTWGIDDDGADFIQISVIMLGITPAFIPDVPLCMRRWD